MSTKHSHKKITVKEDKVVIKKKSKLPVFIALTMIVSFSILPVFIFLAK